MARLRYNGLTATLGADLTSSATSVTFAAPLTHSGGTAVPTITGTDYIPLTILTSGGAVSEIVSLTAYTSGATTGTITRAQESTTGVAHATGDPVVHSATVADLSAAGGAVALLGRATFSAGGTTTAITTTSTSMVDADATNLAVTFTVPASGKVKVRLEALGGGTGAVVVVWGVREGTTAIQEAQVVNGFNGQYIRVGCEFVITGLTPGATKTYKWGHYMSAGSDARIYTGGNAGPAIMSVHDASMV